MYVIWTAVFVVGQAICAYVALQGSNFLMKSGSAGLGAALCGLLWVVRGRKSLGRLWDHCFLMAALLFSIAGDYCLSHRSLHAGMFVFGILLFLCAHLGYLGFAWMHGRIAKSATLGILAGYLLFYFVCLWPYIDAPLIVASSLAYLIVSCISLGAALGIDGLRVEAKWIYVGGIALILFSDTIIGLKEFVDWHRLDFLIMPTYYLAHILAAVTIILYRPTESTRPTS